MPRIVGVRPFPVSAQGSSEGIVWHEAHCAPGCTRGYDDFAAQRSISQGEFPGAFYLGGFAQLRRDSFAVSGAFLVKTDEVTGREVDIAGETYVAGECFCHGRFCPW